MEKQAHRFALRNEYWRGTDTITSNRRIFDHWETIVGARSFSPTIDVDLDLPAKETRPIPNMDGYHIRSTEKTFEYIEQLVKLGISSVTCRLGGGLRSRGEGGYIYAPLLIGGNNNSEFEVRSDEMIVRHASFYKELRSRFPKAHLYIIADPFGLAPNLSDGAWGARDTNGRLDFAATARLLETLAVAFVGAGADAILTMGRVEYEVALTRAALRRAGLVADVLAFSQNIESKAAYVYLEKLGKGDSKQKILPGNYTEMKIRTITDLYEGASDIIVKPSDNLHMIQFTADLISRPDLGIETIQSIIDGGVLDSHTSLTTQLRTILEDKSAFAERAGTARVGTYTVSGSYFVDQLLRSAKGDHYLFQVQDERYRNIASVIASAKSYIIDRSAEWYLRHAEARSDSPASVQAYKRRPVEIFDVV